jgi:hypothetical protein
MRVHRLELDLAFSRQILTKNLLFHIYGEEVRIEEKLEKLVVQTKLPSIGLL